MIKIISRIGITISLTGVIGGAFLLGTISSGHSIWLLAAGALMVMGILIQELDYKIAAFFKRKE